MPEQTPAQFRAQLLSPIDHPPHLTDEAARVAGEILAAHLGDVLDPADLAADLDAAIDDGDGEREVMRILGVIAVNAAQRAGWTAPRPQPEPVGYLAGLEFDDGWYTSDAGGRLYADRALAGGHVAALNGIDEDLDKAGGYLGDQPGWCLLEARPTNA